MRPHYRAPGANRKLTGSGKSSGVALRSFALVGFRQEIGEISQPLQAKLLRVLQERTFERVGGTTSIHVDIRVIAATNRNLEQLVGSREFRGKISISGFRFFPIHISAATTEERYRAACRTFPGAF